MAVGMVASDGAQALGYMVYSLRKRFIEVHRMAVHPDYRNRGIGRMMIERIESKLHCIKRSRAVFVVRESNLEGQLFLKRNGYKATGIEWGRYDQPEEPGYKFLLSPFDNNLLTNRITNYGDATDGRITGAVSEYAEALQDGAKMPPIDVFHDGSDYWLGDGFHRYHAHRTAGIGTIPVNVHTGTARDARLHAIGANATHGLQRTAADKRRAVEMLLDDEEWSSKSDRQIAEKAKVSRPFAKKIIDERGRKSATVTGADGRTYKAADPSPPSPKGKAVSDFFDRKEGKKPDPPKPPARPEPEKEWRDAEWHKFYGDLIRWLNRRALYFETEVPEGLRKHLDAIGREFASWQGQQS
ncbi:ParB domain-containing protein [Durusdinium trenchii]|uniref:ParB domain-containing protein n=1 Tax=Durusdinium trenchii TaxID=1381693 RepID=A0ABP0RFS6_9DINO